MEILEKKMMLFPRKQMKRRQVKWGARHVKWGALPICHRFYQIFATAKFPTILSRGTPTLITSSPLRPLYSVLLEVFLQVFVAHVNLQWACNSSSVVFFVALWQTKYA